MASGQTHRNPPVKKRIHRSPDTEQEFRNVYDHLRKVDLGPFSFIYRDETEELYLAYFNGQRYVSVLCIDKDGNLDITGTQNDSQPLDEIGM